MAVTTTDPEDVEDFERALVEFQTYAGDPIARIEATLQRSPDFVLGHLFRAINYCLASERRFLAPARASLAVAEGLGGKANEREKMLTRATKQLVEGRWDEACATLDETLRAYPLDIFALQTAHLMDFLRGDAVNLRNRPARVLPEWSPSMPGYSYIHGFYAFGLEEMNEYERAERHGRRALETEPYDPWAIHAVVHVMEMQGRSAEGIDFLESRQQDWAPGNSFAYHNWWHLGLMYLERREDAKVLQIFDDHIVNDVENYSMGLVDVTAMLWRLKLLGIAVDDRMNAVARAWEGKLEDEAGYYAFNDFHAAMAFAACDDEALLDRLEARLEDASAVRVQQCSPLARDVGIVLVRALRAYRSGQYDRACRDLLSVRDVAQRFGGSHAQRDVIALTLLDSARRADDRGLVRAIVNERVMAKPDGVLAGRILDRAA
jgi:tetratricopeptide (TPR) repeat protein